LVPVYRSDDSTVERRQGMKRKALIIVAALIAVTGGLFYMAGAQHMHGGGMRGQKMMMPNDSTVTRPMMGPCRGGMGGCGGMMGMGMMTARRMVAVDDGIVVAVGNQLIKYDKNLKKKSEVTLEIDEKQVRSMIEHMRRMHGMYDEMMETEGEKKKE
jgi:hypothetical protein